MKRTNSNFIVSLTTFLQILVLSEVHAGVFLFGKIWCVDVSWNRIVRFEIVWGFLDWHLVLFHFLLIIIRYYCGLLHFGLPDYFLIRWTSHWFGLDVCFVVTLQEPVIKAIRLKTVRVHNLAEEVAAKFIVGLLFELQTFCVIDVFCELLWEPLA